VTITHFEKRMPIPRAERVRRTKKIKEKGKEKKDEKR
jgi:hypothetical protein